MITENNLQMIENLLVKKKMQLINSQKILEMEKNLQSDPITKDLDDQSILAKNEEVIDALYMSNTLELNKIAKALEKIKTGEYGKCSKCGTRIKIKRLKALPYESSCFKCSTI